MRGKRLRIRARLKKLSDHNLDWLAGRQVGNKDGYAAGYKAAKIEADRDHVLLLRTITGLEQKVDSQKVKLQQESYKVLDAKRASAIQHNKVVSLELQLAAEQQRPSTSQWLHLPPFVLQKDEPWDPSDAMDKAKYMATLYGAVTGRTSSRFPSAPPMAEGGFIAPEFSRRFIEQIMHGPPMGILQSSQMVRMLSPTRPPRDPIFHWNADLAHEVEDGEAMVQLTDMSEHHLDAVRDAFRMPLQVSSEVRTPEAEEGIRQASAGGVTDMAGGHSHTIELGITVDDSELRDLITRVDALAAGEILSNVGISANQMQSVMERVLHLERMAGVEVPEESPSEENVNVTGRSDPPGEE